MASVWTTFDFTGVPAFQNYQTAGRSFTQEDSGNSLCLNPADGQPLGIDW